MRIQHAVAVLWDPKLIPLFVVAPIAGALLVYAVYSVTVGKAEPKYGLGTIVQLRVLEYPGIVSKVSCMKKCEYLVRYYKKPDRPSWTQEHELQPLMQMQNIH